MSQNPAQKQMNWTVTLAALVAFQAWIVSPYIVQPMFGSCSTGAYYQDILKQLWFMPDLERRISEITPAFGDVVTCNYAAFLLTTLVLSVIGSSAVVILAIMTSFNYKTVHEFHPLKPNKSYALGCGGCLCICAFAYFVTFIIPATILDLGADLALGSTRYRRMVIVHPDSIGLGTLSDSLTIFGTTLALSMSVFFGLLILKEKYYE